MSTGIANQPSTKRTVDWYDTHSKNSGQRQQTVELPDDPVTARTIIVAAGYPEPVAGSTLALDGVVISPSDWDTPLDPVPQEATYIAPVVGG